jgi:hypothetical protein
MTIKTTSAQSYQNAPSSGAPQYKQVYPARPVEGAQVLPSRGVVLQDTQLEDCQNNGLDLEYVTTVLPATATGGAWADRLIQFQRPHRLFMLVSIQQLYVASSFFIHMAPLGLQGKYDAPLAGIAISPNGSEQWIPYFVEVASTAGASVSGRWVKFRKPIDRFFLDVDHPNGGLSQPFQFTWLGTDDVEITSANFGT